MYDAGINDTKGAAMPGTTIFEPGSQTDCAAFLPSATEPAFQVGDVLYVGSGTRRLRITGVEYVLMTTRSPTGPTGDVAGRMIHTEDAPAP